MGHQYLDAVLAAARTDRKVSKAFLSTIAMVVPPAALLHLAIAMRILRHMLGTHGKKKEQPPMSGNQLTCFSQPLKTCLKCFVAVLA